MAKPTKKQEKEQFILKNMEKLEISREEAEELWSFDHDEIDNEEVEKIEKKKEENKEKAPSKIGKVLTMKAKKKIDEQKDKIISTITAFLESDPAVINPQKMTANKTSFKDELGSYYTVAITKHKSKPDGYSDNPKQKEEPLE